MSSCWCRHPWHTWAALPCSLQGSPEAPEGSFGDLASLHTPQSFSSSVSLLPPAGPLSGPLPGPLPSVAFPKPLAWCREPYGAAKPRAAQTWLCASPPGRVYPCGNNAAQRGRAHPAVEQPSAVSRKGWYCPVWQLCWVWRQNTGSLLEYRAPWPGSAQQRSLKLDNGQEVWVLPNCALKTHTEQGKGGWEGDFPLHYRETGLGLDS